MSYETIKMSDPELYGAMKKELERQRDHIELIASENFTSRAVMEAMGSHLTNKYAEGYPGARYYGGCEYVDIVEQLAIDRAKELFGAEHANVQPHSGSQANVAVYLALLKPGDTILGMDLSHGGHLTHGSKASISGKYFNACFYGVDPETEMIDYETAMQTAGECKPKLIIADECISALDVSIQAQVVNLMNDIQQETGCAYLFIAHDLSMVKYISDRIGVLHLGHLLETGTTEEIFNHPVHPYTRSLLSAIPSPNPVVEKKRVAETYDYKTSGIDYTKGTKHLVEGSHYVRCTDEEFSEWMKKAPLVYD